MENLGVGGEDNIKRDVREIDCEGVDWIHLVQDRFLWWVHVNTIMNLQVS
jgi:hypothetical protein